MARERARWLRSALVGYGLGIALVIAVYHPLPSSPLTAGEARPPIGETAMPAPPTSPTAEIALLSSAQGPGGEAPSPEDADAPTVPELAPDLLKAAAPPVRITGVWPAPGEAQPPARATPEIRFGEPIADRLQAEQAVRVDPAIPGRFEWLSPDRVRFVPDWQFPAGSEVRVTVRPGPDGVRGAGGGFLEHGYLLAFPVRSEKVIDVNLDEETLRLIEDGQVVLTTLTATGVRGAETPLGEFRVEVKLPGARFRGINPSGRAYDIPDVPWVLGFWGDYTIHGAPWREEFGTPQSNGCVSLPTEIARVVYDWADIGTVVRIHK